MVEHTTQWRERHHHVRRAHVHTSLDGGERRGHNLMLPICIFALLALWGALSRTKVADRQRTAAVRQTHYVFRHSSHNTFVTTQLQLMPPPFFSKHPEPQLLRREKDSR